MVQCGTVWCSVVQCGAVWYSVVQCGTVWCSVVQYVCMSMRDMELELGCDWIILTSFFEYGASWCCAVQCGAAWYSVVQCGTVCMYVHAGYEDGVGVWLNTRW